MDKNNEQKNAVETPKSIENESALLALGNNQGLYFIYKKTERIAAAAHLVTNLIKDSEPLKNQIRKKSLDLVSDTMSSCADSVTQKRGGEKLVLSFVEFISLFEIAYLNKMISDMNYAVMKRELHSVIELIKRDVLANIQSLIFSSHFFTVPDVDQANSEFTQRTSSFPEYPGVTSAHTVSADPVFYKGHENKGQHVSLRNVPDTAQLKQKEKSEIVIKDKSSQGDRRQTILNIVKAKKEISITDVVGSIKGCSEKTIQRELLAMVHAGVLKKQGERRWSKYTLA